MHSKDCEEGSPSPLALQRQIEAQPLVKEEEETVIVKKEKEDSNDYLLTPSKERPHHCQLCNKAFTSRQNLRTHLFSHTGERPYVCDTCGKGFTMKRYLTVHERYHSGERRHPCGSCGKRFFSTGDLQKHIRRKHAKNCNEESLSPSELPKQIETQPLVKEEKETVDIVKKEKKDIDGHLCKFCDKVFTQKHNLKAHLFYHTGERPFVCNTCQKGFTRKCSLQAHETIHCGEKPYPCGTCGKGFTRAYDLRRHEKSHTIPVETHSGKETVDSVKKEEEDNVGHLAEHLLTYFQERPHQCQLCEKAFTSKQNLRMHLLSHTGELPYACDTCGKRFARRHYLTVHERSHSGEKPFPCGTCEERFRTSCSRYRHQQSVHKITIREIHSVKKEKEAVDSVIKEEEEEDSSDHLLTPSKERPHQCKLCNKAFTSRPILRTHIRSHTGERPYVCETCGKGFITKRYLTVHERYHSGERRHPCGSCGKRFFSTGDLQKHEKRHIRKFSKIHMRNNSGEHTHGKPFSNSSNLNQHKSILIAGDPLSCPLCSYKATSSHDILFHIQRMHAKDGNDESPSFSELQGQVLKSEAPS